ncbi:MAG TPA: LamG domain-containing protein [Rhizobacter sp.]|nr:LamG domain-containing protein [Rhizobacter sp.]
MSSSPVTALCTALRRASACALLGVCALLPAQAATYSNAATAYSWIDPSAHTRVTWTSGASCSAAYAGAPVDDDITAQIPIGFTFTYGAVNYTQLQVMSNGRLQFNNGYCGFGTQTVGPPPTYPLPYPDANLPRTMRVFGPDLDATSSGAVGICPTSSCYVSYATVGSAPDRRFVVTWTNVPEWGQTTRTGSFNLQGILVEGSNEFVFQFGTGSHPTNGSAQIGWELSTTDFDVWASTVLPTANTAVRFFLPNLIANFRMDDLTWSGAGSVVNTQTPAMAGSPVGAAQENAGGYLCRGGAILPNTSASVIDAVDTGYDVDTQIGSTGTISFWYRSVAPWSGAGSQASQVFDATVANNAWFYLTKLSTGRLSFNVSDNAGTVFQVQSPVYAFAANTWTHIAVTWKLTPVAANNRLQIYVNGALAQSTAASTVQPLSAAIGTLYMGDNRSSFISSIGSGNSANGAIDEVRIYNSEISAVAVQSDFVATRSCTVTASTAPTAFNAFETSTAAGTTTGGIIKTKVAGTAFGLDIVALKTGPAIETGFNDNVLLELVDLSGGAACAARPRIGNVNTVYISSAPPTPGRKTFGNFAEANAWQNMGIRMSYLPTTGGFVIGCSTDNFAIRPSSFNVVVSDADWQTAGTARTLANSGASGGNVHKAGRPFTITATAVNSAVATTTNYSGSPVGAFTASVLPATCASCVFSAGSFTGSAGIMTSTTASYNEVGVFSMQLTDSTFAAVDASDSTLVERSIPSGTVTVGRFVPDHFDVGANAPLFTPGCSSFTYQGQPFGFSPGTPPVLTVTARNFAGATTANYTGSLWKISGANITGQAWTPASGSVSPVGVLPAPTVADLGAGSGSLTFSVGNPGAGGGLAFSRTALTAPFNASLSLAASIADSEGVVYAGNPYSLAGIGFSDGNAATATDAQMRFGRLRLSNAHGSEFVNLPLPLFVEYWSGSSFVPSSADSCTGVSAPTAGTGLSFYAASASNAVVTGDTTATVAAIASGRIPLTLSKPTGGHRGYLDVVVTAPSWLQYDWRGCMGQAVSTLFDDNPCARASFGFYKSPMIFSREMY